MVLSDHSLEQMLDMIEFKEMIHEGIIKDELYMDYRNRLYELILEQGKPYANHLFRSGRIVGLGLENAYAHGNKGDESLPISIKVFEGIKGLVVRIRDSGEGFDFKKTQKKFENEEKYYNGFGGGFKRYNQKEYLVSFENKGTTINILYFFNQNNIVKTKIENMEEELRFVTGCMT